MRLLPGGEVLCHPQVPFGSIHARCVLSQAQTRPHKSTGDAALPPSPSSSTFWGWGCLARPRTPHPFLASVIKGLKRFNGSSGVQQSRDCWISQLLLLTEAAPLGYCTY